MHRMGWLVAMLIAPAMANGAPANRLAPPLDSGAMLTELSNAMRHHDVVERATAADAARVQAAFLAGSWDAFDTWAALVLAGRSSGSTAPATPHGTYWAMVLARPAAERDGFLRFLVPARRLHAGLRDKLSRPALPSCDADCQRLLIGYLAAFPAPMHAADPKLPIGPQLIARSHYPDELTVGLAGDLGLSAAVAALETFVAAERRFHQLFTDYSTSPTEVGGLYRESLRARVKLARADAKLAPKVRKFLDSERGRAEKVWFETTSDSQRGSSSTEVREEDSRVPATSKRTSLEQAGKALGGDRGALTALSERVPVHPEARWIDRIDVSAAAEGRGGKLWLDGHRLIYLDHTSLTGIDVTTGDHLYDAWLGGIASTGGIQGWASTFVVGPGGIIAPIAVRPTKVREPDELKLYTFDVDTGAVVHAVAAPASLPPRGEPAYLAAVPSALWYQDGRQAWRLGLDGKQLEQRTLADDEDLRASGDKVARYTTSRLTIEGPAGRLLERSFADLAGGKDTPVVDSVLLRKDDFVAFARYQLLFAADYTGKLRWRAELDDQWQNRGPEPCAGDRLCVRTAKHFYVFAADGTRVAKLVLPAGTRGVAVAKDVAYLLTDTAVVAQALGGGPTRTIVDQLTGMAHLIGVTDDCVLVSFYLSGQRASDPTGYHLGCFRP